MSRALPLDDEVVWPVRSPAQSISPAPVRQHAAHLTTRATVTSRDR